MKIVLDEGVPEPLAGYLIEHEVHSVGSLGWKGTTNGKLLNLIESVAANVFITADKNIQRQQDLGGKPFGTLLLSTNSWPLIRQHIHAIHAALDDSEPNTVRTVDCGSFIPARFRKPDSPR